MRGFWFAVIAAVATATVSIVVPCAPAVAATDPALVARVDALIASIEANDVRGTSAAYVAAPIVVDEFAPFTWAGPGAAAAWSHDFADLRRSLVATNVRVTHRAALTVDLADDGRRAYIVFPTAYTFRAKGVPTKESGIWTFVFVRAAKAAPWLIATSTWATTKTETVR